MPTCKVATSYKYNQVEKVPIDSYKWPTMIFFFLFVGTRCEKWAGKCRPEL